MDFCPNCGANIEGLTHHCDCCGMPLISKTTFFTWHTFMTEASGDLYVFVRETFQKLDEVDFSFCANIMQNIEINIFCYPETMITEQRIRNRLYLSPTRRKAKLTIVLHYDDYINASKNEKLELLNKELKSGLIRIEERIPELKTGMAKCVDIIDREILC